MLIAVINIITFSLVMIGAVNWGLVGFFNFNLVSFIFGVMTFWSALIYSLVFASALWLIFMAIYQRKRILFYSEAEKADAKSEYKVRPVSSK